MHIMNNFHILIMHLFLRSLYSSLLLWLFLSDYVHFQVLGFNFRSDRKRIRHHCTVFKIRSILSDFKSDIDIWCKIKTVIMTKFRQLMYGNNVINILMVYCITRRLSLVVQMCLLKFALGLKRSRLQYLNKSIALSKREPNRWRYATTFSKQWMDREPVKIFFSKTVSKNSTKCPISCGINRFCPNLDVKTMHKIPLLKSAFAGLLVFWLKSYCI